MKLWIRFILMTVGLMGCALGQGKANAEILWNDQATSVILCPQAAKQLGSEDVAWKVKQFSWPSLTEVQSHSALPQPEERAACVRWLHRFLNPDRLPLDIDRKLVAMREWGLIQKAADQKRLCDVFIVRFKSMNRIVHIQESPANVVIIVSDETRANDANQNMKEFVLTSARELLKDSLAPPTNPALLHEAVLSDSPEKMIRVSWLIESVIRVKNGRKIVDSNLASRVGCFNVEAETNGKFVRFNVGKIVDGPRVGLDPYKERFHNQESAPNAK